jgi:hypothetical protein
VAAYTDADWGSDRDDRDSIGVYVRCWCCQLEVEETDLCGAVVYRGRIRCPLSVREGIGVDDRVPQGSVRDSLVSMSTFRVRPRFCYES